MKNKFFKNMISLLNITVMVVSMSLFVSCGSGVQPNVNSDVVLIKGLPISIANSPIYEDQAVSVVAPKNELGAQTTGKTDKNLKITRDSKYGGGQFVMKLFTEGLSRAANGEEFASFTNYLMKNQCSLKALKTITKEVFSSELFNAFQLTKNEITFSVYRAILSREPIGNECNTIDQANLMDKIDELMDGQEFHDLLEGIYWGPYFWRENNTERYSGGDVFTSAEFNEMLRMAIDTKVVELPQGALVLVDSTLIIPSGYTIRTEGNPTHYVKFAKFMRIKTQSLFHMMQILSQTTLQNIFCDGNRSGVGKDMGWNMACIGNDTVVWGCRSSDSSSNVHLVGEPNTSNMYFGRNLITAYATNHSDGGWADGIDLYSTNSIVEYNQVVDATDAGLVLFRTLSSKNGFIQNSIIRYNQVCNVGNSCYAGMDFEGVDENGNINDFTGALVYGNCLFTSYTAHMHMCATLSSFPWRATFNKIANHCFYNNFTPNGCFVNTAGGIVINNTVNLTLRGNQFKFQIGDWCYTAPGKRLYSINTENCDGGDFQAGYIDLHATNFIHPSMDIEKAKSYTVTVGYVFEPFVEIPQGKFFWPTKS